MLTPAVLTHPGCLFAAEEVHAVMQLGKKNRTVASTHMNTDSSRSHSLVMVKILAEDRLTQSKTVGKLTLVDLAGSERVKKSGPSPPFQTPCGAFF